jgi:hypothetical protein
MQRGCESFFCWRRQRGGIRIGLVHMNGLATRISTARVERCEALPARKDRLTVVVIGACLVLALLSFGMVAIS